MKHIRMIFIILMMYFFNIIPLCADEIQVVAAIETNSMNMGESFIYQISVKGSNTPEEPQITGALGAALEARAACDRQPGS